MVSATKEHSKGGGANGDSMHRAVPAVRSALLGHCLHVEYRRGLLGSYGGHKQSNCWQSIKGHRQQLLGRYAGHRCSCWDFFLSRCVLMLFTRRGIAGQPFLSQTACVLNATRVTGGVLFKCAQVEHASAHSAAQHVSTQESTISPSPACESV
jgi:hypothetical protein